MGDTLRERGCDRVSPDEISEMFHSGYSWHTPDITYTDRVGYTWWEDLFLHFRPYFLKSGISDREADDIDRIFREKILDPENYLLYEDAKETLRLCGEKGYYNYILSNNYPELEEVVKALGLGTYFEGYVVSAAIGYEKPRPEIFEYAKKTAEYPGLCVMIGDNPRADILGGIAANMHAILVHSDESHFGEDFSVKELSEIPDILGKL